MGALVEGEAARQGQRVLEVASALCCVCCVSDEVGDVRTTGTVILLCGPCFRRLMTFGGLFRLTRG